MNSPHVLPMKFSDQELFNKPVRIENAIGHFEGWYAGITRDGVAHMVRNGDELCMVPVMTSTLLFTMKEPKDEQV